MPYYDELGLMWAQPPPLIEDRPIQRTPAPVRSAGKGSVQQDLLPPIGQHNFLDRMLLGLGEGMVSGYQSLGRAPQNVGDALGQFLAVMPGGGLLGITRPTTRIASPIRAFHGSPHQFDEFDLARIGTGEGAQAYGHGLYFAEAEPVARSYRQMEPFHLDGQPYSVLARDPNFYTLSREHRRAINRLADHRGDIDAAITALQSEMDPASRLAIDLLRTWRGAGRITTPPTGHMYEVSLHARPEQFLDWDRGLSQQDPALRFNLADVLRFHGVPRFNNVGAETTGGQALEFLQRRLGNAADATGEIASAGIPGIRYLDQGSRTAGAGTRNYVVFDPSIIEILRRYGITGPIVGLGAASTLMGDRGDQ